MIKIYSIYILTILIGLILIGLYHQPDNVKSTTKQEDIIKIAIIDSGFGPIPGYDTYTKLCKTGHYDFSTKTNSVGIDEEGHGAIVTALIHRPLVNKPVCYLIYKISFDERFYKQLPIAIQKATDAGASFVNMSLITNMMNPDIKFAMQRGVNKGVHYFVAAGNNNRNLDEVCAFYPQCITGLGEKLTIVGAQEYETSLKTEYSNYGSNVTIWESGEFLGNYGTSFASPRALGLYVSDLLDTKLTNSTKK